MSQQRLPPPPPDPCLIQSRKVKFRGGTVIAEEVWSVEEHERRLTDPQGYRPEACGNCGCGNLHVHDYPLRRPLGQRLMSLLRIVRFICSDERCKATWRVLPAFLARHLWWVWEKIAKATGRDDASPDAAVEEAAKATERSEGEGRAVAERTRRRWRQRLASSSRQLVTLMASRGLGPVQGVAMEVGLEASRRRLVQACERGLGLAARVSYAALAALIDRLERGVRLM